MGFSLWDIPQYAERTAGASLFSSTSGSGLAPLAEAKELVVLAISAQCKGKSIEFLRLPVRLPALPQQAGNTQTGDLPKLGKLGYECSDNRTTTAEEFWKKHGGGK